MNVTETLPQSASEEQNASRENGAATTQEVVTETRDRMQPSGPATPVPSDAPSNDSLNQLASWIRMDAAEDTTTYLHRANTYHDGE
jgi:hypothetical protein